MIESVTELLFLILGGLGTLAFQLLIWPDRFAKSADAHEPMKTTLPLAQPVQKPRYISDSYISGQIIHLMDLLAPGAKPIISNRTIEDCEIRGPVMIALLGGVTIADSGFDGDQNSLFVEIVDRRMIFGAIGLQNCIFRRCRFIAIGIIGTKEQIEQAKKGFAPSTSHKEGSQS